MIIKHTPEAKNAQTDTDKLPDVEAMILEKCEELRQLCYNAKRQVAIVVDAKGKEDGNGMQFWNLSMTGVDAKAEDKANSEEQSKLFNNFFAMINQMVMAQSQGNLAVAVVPHVKQLAENAKELQEDVVRYQKALEKIADYDSESIWSDDRDDAANNMLSIARVALGREDEDVA